MNCTLISFHSWRARNASSMCIGSILLIKKAITGGYKIRNYSRCLCSRKRFIILHERITSSSFVRFSRSSLEWICFTHTISQISSLASMIKKDCLLFRSLIGSSFPIPFNGLISLTVERNLSKYSLALLQASGVNLHPFTSELKCISLMYKKRSTTRDFSMSSIGVRLFFINDPKCVFRCAISEEWIHTKYFDDFLHVHLVFIPLEYEGSSRLENSPGFIKAFLEFLSPIGSKPSIFLTKPWFLTGAHKVRWIKHDEVEGIVIERNIPEVGHDVRLYLQIPSITCLSLELALVYEGTKRVLFVPPKHPSTATHVEYSHFLYSYLVGGLGSGIQWVISSDIFQFVSSYSLNSYHHAGSKYVSFSSSYSWKSSNTHSEVSDSCSFVPI